MRAIVISQPMFFPWIGILEQIRLCDFFLHYDDIPFSKGSFTNRVQLRMPQGSTWLTIPLRKFKLGQNINQIEISDFESCRRNHIRKFDELYRKAPFFSEALEILQQVYESETHSLCELVIRSLEAVCGYFGLGCPPFARSSTLGIQTHGDKSQKVLDLVKALDGDVYITGHGALNYLDHERFEQQGVRVEYIQYEKNPYPQLYQPFDPHVSSLDLIANVGKKGKDLIKSGTRPWREVLQAQAS